MAYAAYAGVAAAAPRCRTTACAALRPPTRWPSLEGTYAVANERNEVRSRTRLGIGLIVTALVLQSAGASLLARRVALRHSYDGAAAGLL